MQREGLEVTDDVSIIEALGRPVQITPGSYTNIKVWLAGRCCFAQQEHTAKRQHMRVQAHKGRGPPWRPRTPLLQRDTTSVDEPASGQKIIIMLNNDFFYAWHARRSPRPTTCR